MLHHEVRVKSRGEAASSDTANLGSQKAKYVDQPQCKGLNKIIPIQKRWKRMHFAKTIKAKTAKRRARNKIFVISDMFEYIKFGAKLVKKRDIPIWNFTI